MEDSSLFSWLGSRNINRAELKAGMEKTHYGLGDEEGALRECTSVLKFDNVK
jgi:hypothetical protein